MVITNSYRFHDSCYGKIYILLLILFSLWGNMGKDERAFSIFFICGDYDFGKRWIPLIFGGKTDRKQFKKVVAVKKIAPMNTFSRALGTSANIFFSTEYKLRKNTNSLEYTLFLSYHYIEAGSLLPPSPLLSFPPLPNKKNPWSNVPFIS